MNIHHVAYLTKNIDRKAEELCRLLGARWLGEPVVDPGQGAGLCSSTSAARGWN